MSSLNPGRLAAVRVLIGVEDGAHAEDLLGELAPQASADRGLAWHLVLGVLRRQGSLDWLLSPLLSRPLGKLDKSVRAALRVGAYELAFSGTARHAAVDQAVEAARAAGSPGGAGLVNAVLRKVDPARLPDDPTLDLPPWLAERWRGMGEGSLAWIARLREAAPLSLVWRGAPVAELATAPARAGGEVVEGAAVLVDQHGPIEAMPGFREGAWWVMDPAAARVADLGWEALGRPTEGWTALDACAAPGGKSFRLATRGAAVTAVDAQARRLQKVGEGARRLGLPVQEAVHDWLRGPCATLGLYDLVLVDAPCTGLGTLRRHPEIKWRRLRSDPAAMAIRQVPILQAAAAHVRPGGVLVYAVCSPEPEEGIRVVEALQGWSIERSLRFAPPTGDEDAFQAFLLRKAG